MTKIVCLEGVDGVGKSTTVSRLCEKYPDRFEVMAFPLPDTKRRLETMHANTSEKNRLSLRYQQRRCSMFYLDFLGAQHKIKLLREKHGNTTHILMDRYFFSTLAYQKKDIADCIAARKYKYGINLEARTMDIWEGLKAKQVYPSFVGLAQPDILILLTERFRGKDEGEEGFLDTDQIMNLVSVMDNYYVEIAKYLVRVLRPEEAAQIDYRMVKAQTENTFGSVERILRENGILD